MEGENEATHSQRKQRVGCFVALCGSRDEIQRWIDEAADVRSFAILEDEDELGALEVFAIRTRSDEGLLDAHVDAAIELLDRGR